MDKIVFSFNLLSRLMPKIHEDFFFDAYYL